MFRSRSLAALTCALSLSVVSARPALAADPAPPASAPAVTPAAAPVKRSGSSAPLSAQWLTTGAAAAGIGAAAFIATGLIFGSVAEAQVAGFNAKVDSGAPITEGDRSGYAAAPVNVAIANVCYGLGAAAAVAGITMLVLNPTPVLGSPVAGIPSVSLGLHGVSVRGSF